jgi:hypothetical protein
MLRCINKGMQLDLLTIKINFCFLLDGRIVIKGKNRPNNILA